MISGGGGGKDLRGGVKEIMDPLIRGGGERNQATFDGRSETNLATSDQNQLVHSDQKQHFITIIVIIFVTILTFLQYL